MGRIRTTLIKRTGKKLLQVYPDKFTTDFTQNKLALVDTVEVRSKKLRNITAGYVTQLMRKQQQKK